MWDFFIGFFSNLFNWVMIILFVLIGVFVGLVFKPKAKNQVMKCLRDRRFIDFNVKLEDAFGVECELEKGYPPQRFVKFRGGFTGRVGRFLKRIITRHIGREGTAYTYELEKGKKLEFVAKKGNPGNVVLKNAFLIGSLENALKGIWGEERYNQIPEDARQQLAESHINVTVDFEEEITPKDLPSMSEEDLYREEDRKGAETWWEGKKLATKGIMINYLFAALAGAGVMAIASKLLGWW